MTSNIGGEEFTSKATQIGFNTSEKEEEKVIRDYEKIKTKILGELDEYFAPEFINRIDKIVVFAPLDKGSLGKIIKIQLQKLVDRLAGVGVFLEYDTKVVSLIAKQTYDPAYGARPIRRFIQEKIEDPIAERLIVKKKPGTISITVSKGEFSFNSIPSRT